MSKFDDLLGDAICSIATNPENSLPNSDQIILALRDCAIQMGVKKELSWEKHDSKKRTEDLRIESMYHQVDFHDRAVDAALAVNTIVFGSVSSAIKSSITKEFQTAGRESALRMLRNYLWGTLDNLIKKELQDTLEGKHRESIQKAIKYECKKETGKLQLDELGRISIRGRPEQNYFIRCEQWTLDELREIALSHTYLLSETSGRILFIVELLTDIELVVFESQAVRKTTSLPFLDLVVLISESESSQASGTDNDEYSAEATSDVSPLPSKLLTSGVSTNLDAEQNDLIDKCERAIRRSLENVIKNLNHRYKSKWNAEISTWEYGIIVNTIIDVAQIQIRNMRSNDAFPGLKKIFIDQLSLYYPPYTPQIVEVLFSRCKGIYHDVYKPDLTRRLRMYGLNRRQI